MHKKVFVGALVVGLLVGGAVRAPAPPSPDAPPTCAEVAAAYLGYRQITDKAVFVNPELAMLCRGASQQDVEAARVKHGPHADTAVLIYMNDPAAEAFRGRTAYPAGSVVVKQKQVLGFFDAAGQPTHDQDNGVGGMIKRAAGYDPAHGDWEYFYFDQPKGRNDDPFMAGTAVAKASLPSKIESGRIASCVQCHDAAEKTDYVFGTWAVSTNH